MPPSIFRTKNNRSRRFIFGEIGLKSSLLAHQATSRSQVIRKRRSVIRGVPLCRSLCVEKPGNPARLSYRYGASFTTAWAARIDPATELPRTTGWGHRASRLGEGEG